MRYLWIAFVVFLVAAMGWHRDYTGFSFFLCGALTVIIFADWFGFEFHRRFSDKAPPKRDGIGAA